MNPRISIYRSRKKSVIITVIGLLLGAGGGLVLLYSGEAATGWMLIIAAVFVVILGVGSVSDKKPHVLLTENGITDLDVVREEIQWDAILGVDDFWFRGQNIVRILLPRTYKPSLVRPTWFHRLDRLYQREGVKTIYIQTRNLQVNSRRLIEIIRQMIAADPDQRKSLLEEGLR